MSWGHLPMRGRVLFSPGGPLGIDKVHSQLVTALCNRKRERNQRGRVHREVHDAATETMCSPGQHNKALSRTTWFECTSDGKGERRTAPYASNSPHHISTAMNEALTQTAPTAVRQSEPKPFTTCLLHNAEKKSFLGLHRAEPSGRTGSVFRLQEHRELQREREREL